jgi:hypothetical protein
VMVRDRTRFQKGTISEAYPEARPVPVWRRTAGRSCDERKIFTTGNALQMSLLVTAFSVC